MFRGEERLDVVVWGDARHRESVTGLRELGIDTPTGGQVPLGELADIDVAPIPNVINREGASRQIDVTCNVQGRDLGSVAQEIEHPMAVVIVGGLLTSSLLNLLLMPALYARFGEPTKAEPESRD